MAQSPLCLGDICGSTGMYCGLEVLKTIHVLLRTLHVYVKNMYRSISLLFPEQDGITTIYMAFTPG